MSLARKLLVYTTSLSSLQLHAEQIFPGPASLQLPSLSRHNIPRFLARRTLCLTIRHPTTLFSRPILSINR